MFEDNNIHSQIIKYDDREIDHKIKFIFIERDSPVFSLGNLEIDTENPSKESSDLVQRLKSNYESLKTKVEFNGSITCFDNVMLKDGTIHITLGETDYVTLKIMQSLTLSEREVLESAGIELPIIPIVSAIILNEKKEVLLGERPDGALNIWGGSVSVEEIKGAEQKFPELMLDEWGRADLITQQIMLELYEELGILPNQYSIELKALQKMNNFLGRLEIVYVVNLSSDVEFRLNHEHTYATWVGDIDEEFRGKNTKLNPSLNACLRLIRELQNKLKTISN